MKLQTALRMLSLILALGCLLAAPAFAADTLTEADSAVTVDYDSLSPEEAVYTYLTQEMGLSTAAACGVLANIQYESGFDPTVWGDGGTSYGLCQWHNERCTNLTSFCNQNGYDPDTVYGQMAYLQYELTTGYPSVLNYLTQVADSADGAYDAAWYWCYYFEIPASREQEAASRGQVAASTYYPAYASGAYGTVYTGYSGSAATYEETEIAASSQAEYTAPPADSGDDAEAPAADFPRDDRGEFDEALPEDRPARFADDNQWDRFRRPDLSDLPAEEALPPLPVPEDTEAVG